MGNSINASKMLRKTSKLREYLSSEIEKLTNDKDLIAKLSERIINEIQSKLVSLPEIINDPSVHRHPLYKKDLVTTDECTKCEKECRGCGYECSDCLLVKWKGHVSCAQDLKEFEAKIDQMLANVPSEIEKLFNNLPASLSSIAKHKHDLKKVFDPHGKDRSFTCDYCKKDQKGWSYCCKDCNYDIHPSCAFKLADYLSIGSSDIPSIVPALTLVNTTPSPKEVTDILAPPSLTSNAEILDDKTFVMNNAEFGGVLKAGEREINQGHRAWLSCDGDFHGNNSFEWSFTVNPGITKAYTIINKRGDYLYCDKATFDENVRKVWTFRKTKFDSSSKDGSLKNFLWYLKKCGDFYEVINVEYNVNLFTGYPGVMDKEDNSIFPSNTDSIVYGAPLNLRPLTKQHLWILTDIDKKSESLFGNDFYEVWNSEYLGLLHSGEWKDSILNGSHRLWVSPGEILKPDAACWKFIFQPNSRSYQIVNKKGSYLYSGSRHFGNNFHKAWSMATSNSDTKFLWYVKKTGDFYEIANVKYGNNLFCGTPGFLEKEDASVFPKSNSLSTIWVVPIGHSDSLPHPNSPSNKKGQYLWTIRNVNLVPSSLPKKYDEASLAKSNEIVSPSTSIPPSLPEKKEALLAISVAPILPKRSEETSDVYVFLVEKVKIGDKDALVYCQRLNEEGYESIDLLIGVLDENILTIDVLSSKPLEMKKPHAISFLKKLNDFKNNIVSPPTSPTNSIPHLSKSNSSMSKSVKLLSSIKTSGSVSSGTCVVLDGLFFDGFSSEAERVKIKMVKSSSLASLEKEFNFAETLNRKSSECFIKVFGLFKGSQLVPCEGSGDDLTGYLGLVMERGGIDLAMYLKENNIPTNERLLLGEAICNIVAKAHSSKVVLMDLKPANIVRVVDSETTKIFNKAIDFDNAFAQDSDISETASGTPRYISPEIARLLLARMKKQKLKVLADKSIDIFALGLIIFELGNEGKSLWEILGISIDNDAAIFECAASLTDKIILDAIDKTFKGDINNSFKSWLKDALAVNPAARWSAEKLINAHSLFRKQAATLDIGKTIARMETKVDEIDRKLVEIATTLNQLFIFIKSCNGKLNFPPSFIVIPQKEDEKVEKKSWFSFDGLKTNLDRTKDKILTASGLEVKVTFVFICDGCSTDPHTTCTRKSKGFTVSLPGRTLRKLGPALVFTAKIVNFAMKVGKLSGLPIPSEIPGASELGDLLDNYSGMLDFPLNDTELDLFELAGNDVDPSNPPCQSDMLSTISNNFSSFDDDMKKKSLEFVKSSYSEAQKWLDKLNPTWEDTKNSYDLERYESGADILWLCQAHGKKMGLKKMVDKYS